MSPEEESGRGRTDGRERRGGDGATAPDATVPLGRRSVLGLLGASLAWGLGGSGTASASGEHGHGDDAALSLVPPAAATHRAVADGNWTDGATWAGGTPPGDGARVLVESDVTVTLAREDDARLAWVRVEGTLRFDPAADTRLGVETLVTTADGRLEIGTAGRPVAPDRTAEIEFVDRGPIDVERDPTRLGKGLLALGETAIHGAPTTSWTELAAFPRAGEDHVDLPEPPENWRPGDRVVVPGFAPDENRDEHATVRAVDGRRVHLDVDGNEGFAFDHVPPREHLDAYALKLNRTVRLVSEVPDLREAPDRSVTDGEDHLGRRGHVMFLSRHTDVHAVEFRELGRTDKKRPFTNPDYGTPPSGVPPNPKARYACHFHRFGNDPDRRPAVVRGCSVRGSPGWGYVNHHSYGLVTDCVSYDVDGAGFVAEAGDEIGTFADNFALLAEGSGELSRARDAGFEFGTVGRIDDFGHSGHGFWFQSPAVEVRGNVAANADHSGIALWCRAIHDRGFPDGFGPESLDHRRSLAPSFDAGLFGRAVDVFPWQASERGQYPSSLIPAKGVYDCTVFACGSGIEHQRNGFGAETPGRFARWTRYEGVTVHSVGNGRELAPPDALTAGGGNSGWAGGWTGQVRLVDCEFYGTGGGTGFNVGTDSHNLLIEDCRFEGWATGVEATGEETFVVRSTVLDNAVTNVHLDLDTGREVTLAWLDGNDYRGDPDEGHVTIGDDDGEDGDLRLRASPATIRLDDRPVYRSPGEDAAADPRLADAYVGPSLVERYGAAEYGTGDGTAVGTDPDAAGGAYLAGGEGGGTATVGVTVPRDGEYHLLVRGLDGTIETGVDGGPATAVDLGGRNLFARRGWTWTAVAPPGESWTGAVPPVSEAVGFDLAAGRHRVDLSLPAGVAVDAVALVEGDPTAVLGEGAGVPAPLVGDASPTDTDGDGRYEDVDGDGEANVLDVASFLDRFEDVPPADRAAFDFSGDGRIDVVDVATLLDEL